MSTGTNHTDHADSAPLEQRLKAQIDGYPVHVRPELAREAYRAHRRHRVVSRATAAVGAAGAIALVVALVATAPFGATPGGRQPGSAGSPLAGGKLNGSPADKYLKPWVPPAGVIPPFGLQPVAAGNSLTAARAAGDILWVRMTTEAIPASDSVIDAIFGYRTASRHLTYYPDGKPWDDDNSYVRPGADGKSVSVHTVVNYDNRTVVVETSPAVIMSKSPVLGGCASTQGCRAAPAPQDACATARSMGLADIDFQATPGAARDLLSCKGQVVTRGLAVDGVNAIKIAGQDRETLWINATTYLPIKIVISYPSGDRPPAGYNNAKSTGQTYQYTWLPPTSANLAYLGIPIPAGFKHPDFGNQASVPVGAALAGNP